MQYHAKKWIGGALLLIFLMVLTPCLIGWKMRDVANSMKMGGGSHEISIYQDLSLTDLQKEKIQVLENEYQKQMVGFCKGHCTARMKIGELLKSGCPDQAVLLHLQREVADAYSASEEATLKHVLRVGEVLTPDQKVLFLKKYGGQIQASCPIEFVR